VNETRSRNRFGDSDEEILCLLGNWTESFQNNGPSLGVDPERPRSMVKCEGQETEILVSEEVRDQLVLLLAIDANVTGSSGAFLSLRSQSAPECADVDCRPFGGRSIARGRPGG
jgi:hypothetical protein